MPLIILQHSPSTGAERLGTALRDFGHRLKVVRVGDDPLPADLDDVDGIVATGGPQSPLDKHDWIDAEKSLLRDADEAGLPVIGICLGAQILAQALGGEVGPVDGGMEVGWHDLTLSPVGVEDPLHAGLPWQWMQFHWHGHQVTRAPADARVLASTKRCPIQSYVRGLRTYGFQYHPEVTPATIDRWIAEHPADLDAAGVTADHLRADTTRHYPAFERLTDRLFERVALLLAPADRRHEGLVKDLHH